MILFVHIWISVSSTTLCIYGTKTTWDTGGPTVSRVASRRYRIFTSSENIRINIARDCNQPRPAVDTEGRGSFAQNESRSRERSAFNRIKHVSSFLSPVFHLRWQNVGASAASDNVRCTPNDLALGMRIEFEILTFFLNLLSSLFSQSSIISYINISIKYSYLPT